MAPVFEPREPHHPVGPIECGRSARVDLGPETADLSGAVVAWGSAGTAGFKGSRKSTPYAAALAADGAAKRAMEHGMRQIEVFVKGPGSGREQAIRSLQAAGLEVSAITDVTPLPHNGCRAPKRRRV